MRAGASRPAWFAHDDEGRSLPLRAELTVVVVVVALIALLDPRSAIGLSGVAVLGRLALQTAQVRPR